jgi:hypothetical protein
MSTQENLSCTPGTININTVSTSSTLVISVTSSLHGGPSGSRSTDEPTDLNPTLRRVYGSTGPPTKRRVGHTWGGEKSEPLRSRVTIDCIGLIRSGRDVKSPFLVGKSNLGPTRLSKLGSAKQKYSPTSVKLLKSRTLEADIYK